MARALYQVLAIAFCKNCMMLDVMNDVIMYDDDDDIMMMCDDNDDNK